ncbi:MAG: alpha/beta hydrolase [Sciscionella sp.]|nr:alpha/beta hydrolase [Sciscionella sp.]
MEKLALTAGARAVFGLPRPVRRLLAGRPIRRDGQTLDLDMQLMLRLAKVAGESLAHGGDVATARALLDANAQIGGGRRIEPIAVRELSINTGEQPIAARLYTPEGLTERSPLLVYYHGGGWVVGSLDSHDNLCRFLAQHANIRVLSVDYRLAPEHRFPAAVDDALAALRYAHSNARALHIDPSMIALGGDSAGGNLAAVTAHLAARAGGPTPAFLLLFYPAVDNTVRRRSRDEFAHGFYLTDEHIKFYSDHYCPDVEVRNTDPRFSIGIADDLSGLPPTYLATAGFDPLRDEGEAFARRLTDAGVPVVLRRHSDLLHGFASMLAIGDRGREAVAEAVGALRTGLAIGSRGEATTTRTLLVEQLEVSAVDDGHVDGAKSVDLDKEH